MKSQLFRSWVVVLVTCLGVAITASLGRWQLQRADTKQALFDSMQARQGMVPLANAQLPCDGLNWSTMVFRPVVARGYWMPQLTLFLDNRVMDGRTGRLVLTPLRLDPAPRCGPRVMLVQRGWVPRDPLVRERLPDIQQVSGLVQVAGRLSEAPSSLLSLGAASGPAGPLRQNVDLTELAAQWQLPLLPGSLLQLRDDDPAAHQSVPLLRHWWEPQRDVGKHHAYAAQWFAMSATMVGLYVWWTWWHPRRKAVAVGALPPNAPPPSPP